MNELKKEHINIGTLGHVDHGKTTLSAAITKYLAKKGLAKFKDYGDIDNAPEEEARGITISTAHIEFETEKRHYSLIDCPGHADYINNMIVGTAQMDGGAILVLDATQGVAAQTTEHLRLAHQLGIKHLVVFLNKIDIVLDLSDIEIKKLEIAEELAKFGFDSEKTPIIGGSALCALEGKNPEMGEEAIKDLLDAIDNHIPTPTRDTSSPFLMIIGGNNHVPGRGNVATGEIVRGTLDLGKEVEIVGLRPTIKAIVIGIQMHHKDYSPAVPGLDAGLLFRGIEREELETGRVIAAPGTIKAYKEFEAKGKFFKKEEGGKLGDEDIKNGYQPQFII